MADPQPDSAPAKLTYRIPEVVAATGIARSSLYELIKAGDLKTRKSGARTLIERTELERFIASLPEGGA